jgi:hypothetical protein
MKFFLAMALLMASVTTGNSQLTPSQESQFCKVLLQLVESSRESFESIKNERKKGVLELYYTSKVNLPTAADTRIILRGDSWFLTSKLLENKDRKKVEKDFITFSNILKGCLKSWKSVAGESVSSKGKSSGFKEAIDSECGPRVSLTMDENPTHIGYYKVAISIHSN